MSNIIKISKRLLTAASLVGGGKVLADVGTDHGYVPIYLVQKGRIPRAIAMDIGRGPIERAAAHIQKYGMEGYIETRLSDGVAGLSLGEADSILIAGMGGGLIMRILTDGEEICRSVSELILQPQSEIPRVRKFLAENGYGIKQEAFVEEEGKYYPMMRVVSGRKAAGENIDMVAFRYGGLLLKERNPVLKEYLLKEQKTYSDILAGLKQQPLSEKIAERISEVEQVLEWNNMALAYYIPA